MTATAIAEHPARTRRSPANGSVAPRRDDDSPDIELRHGAFRRPYIVESVGFAQRLEVELTYADNELGMIRANIMALQDRETDLVKIRDAALHGLGIIHGHPQEEEENA